MAPKFGTSGLRGLVTELTSDLVQAYTRAFLVSCDTGPVVHIGWDLRPSSEAIAQAVAQAVAASGRTAMMHGTLPTPALALAALAEDQGAIMITGSHIPADRNGLKFYTRQGEIGKDDEANIVAAYAASPTDTDANGEVVEAGTVARAAYVARYADAFGSAALSGLRVGVYQHSSVARDIMVDVIRALGAEPVPLARSDVFIPVDTEAVDTETREMLSRWTADNNLDALISTDGDADRPMVADRDGQIIPGDVLGALTSQVLDADIICTPISSNTMVSAMPAFESVHLTRIGSPHVIAAMEGVLAGAPDAKVVGFEANGGFLLGYTAQGPNGPLLPLMTRDCLLPILAPLLRARQTNQPLSALVEALPPRFTAADRLVGISPDASAPFLASLTNDAPARHSYFKDIGQEVSVDLTDGLRVTFETGEIVHLRPSGNAPEFRCYTEAETSERAKQLLSDCLERLRESVGKA